MMHIRAAKPEDAEAIADIYAPFVRETIISFETDPPTTGETARRIEKTLRTHPWLVAVSDRQILGYAYAGPYRSRAAYRWSCEVSAYVADGAHRRGIGHALYTRLFQVLREQSFATALAGIGLPNAASVAFHESFGFAHIGIFRGVGYKFGAWHDVAWYDLAIGDLGPSPSEPIAFSAFDPDRIWPVETVRTSPEANAD